MTRLSRLADRLAVYLCRNSQTYELGCVHCDTDHDIPMRKVITYVTAYARESFAAASCPACGRMVAQTETLDVCERLMNDGAKFRVFHELPQLTEQYISEFTAALEQGDVIELARGER